MSKSKSLPGVDIADHSGAGYKALLKTDGDWIAAIKNGTPDSWKIPSEIDTHPDTDELFVLVSGRGVLMTAGRGAKPGKMSVAEMKKFVLYNVKAGTWHVNSLSPDAKFIIVERGGKFLESSKRVKLKQAQQDAIRVAKLGLV